MENPNSYTSVIILLLNQSRLKNLTQFDGAYVAEFLWLTIMNYIHFVKTYRLQLFMQEEYR